MKGLCSEVEKFGRGIGNTSRYHIIETLFDGGKTVGELTEKTKLSQSLVSQHLRILKETGIVRDERQGQKIFYTLDSTYLINLLARLTKELKPPRRKHVP